jgi:UPF0755 protein
MKPELKLATVFFSITLASTILLGLIWWRWANQPVCSFVVSKNECPELSFSVRKGDGINKISSLLEKRGLVRSALAFKIQVWKLGLVKKIQAGDFLISSGETPAGLAQLLIKGNYDRRVTLIEGLRAEEIGEHLQKQNFNIDMGKWMDLIKSEGLEGELFPDTYMIEKEATADEIIALLVRNFRKKFNPQLVNEAAAKGINQESVIILASLVEREAAHEEDRPLVAGILLKRLARNWPLQVDATVQYAVANRDCYSHADKPLPKAGCNWWPKKLTDKDTKIKSPYNTYLNRGLPPGPICNPGLSAIKAVVSPQESDYWFYLSDSKGDIHYAKTAVEQTENIHKYLLQESENRGL